MEILRYRLVYAIISTYLMISVVNADVTISNGYYTSGSSYMTSGNQCGESVFLHDMDYENSVGIAYNMLISESSARSSDGSDGAEFRHSISTSSGMGSQGASLEASGKDLSYSKLIVGSEANFAKFSYLMGSGQSKATYFTPKTSVQERLELINARYRAEFGVYSLKLFSSGEGNSEPNAPGGFNHDIWLEHLGTQCKIESFLRCSGDAEANIVPVIYDWAVDAYELDRAITGISIQALQGNRNVELGIKGESDVLTNKFAPDTYAGGDPAQMDPKTSSGTTESRDLYMIYTIN